MFFAARLMKASICSSAICVTGAVLAAGPTTRSDAKLLAPVQSQCSVENKTLYFREFQESYEVDKKDLTKALEFAKKYLSCPDDLSNQDVLASLNLAVGEILRSKNSSNDAIPYFIKAASLNSTLKSSARTYADLAEAYLEGPYEQLSHAYTSTFAGKKENRESRLALENINQLVDRVIDAYARAVALSGADWRMITPRAGLTVRSPRSEPRDWIEDLTEFYRFRHHGSVAELRKLIETVLSHPLPDPPTPITVLPREKEREERITK